MRFIQKILILIFFTNLAYTDITDSCYTKMTQIMKPSYPRTNYQGYAEVKFNINKYGTVENVRIISSDCAIARDNDKNIIFKRCPFFKSNAVAAAKYLKFKPPVDSLGNACEIKGKTHKYKFSRFKIDGDDFLLREDIKKRTMDTNLYMNSDLASDSFMSNKQEANQGLSLEKPRK